ncbi:MAG: hypothetical protein HS113_21090 [Verrucomicrobiales bacterium]|nr:hypothetical protein [Verrucomicrobiales bacterium]
MSDFAILHPVREVPVRGETVTVREMRWKDAVAFSERLSGMMGQFTEPDGGLSITPSKLGAVIARSGSLATELLERATGKEREFLDELRPVEVFELLAAAVEVNIHEDLLGKARGVGQALRTALGGQIKPPGDP